MGTAVAHFHHLSGPGARREPGRAHSALRWPHRAASSRKFTARMSICEVLNGGLLGRAPGHQPAGNQGQHSVADREGRERPRVRAEARGGPGGRLVRAHRRGCAAQRKRCDRGARLRDSGDRQAGEAAGHRQPGRDSGSRRRRDGGARRSRRRGGAGEGAAHPEARHPPRPRLAQAGDHRDADAGVHDREPAAHARRSQRRGQRDLRRHRRGHALGRDRQRQVSARGGGR